MAVRFAIINGFTGFDIVGPLLRKPLTGCFSSVIAVSGSTNGMIGRSGLLPIVSVRALGVIIGEGISDENRG